jgi:2-methylcitrate dehydratase PrpD
MTASSDHPSESDASQGITRSLARYVVAIRFDEPAAAVLREAQRSLLNWMGVAVGGSRHETIEIVLAAIKPFIGAPQATTLFGRAERLDVMHAVLINGTASRAASRRRGCIELRNAHNLDIDLIEKMDLDVNPLVLELTAKKKPMTGLEGKFSVYCVAALAIVAGRAEEAEFADKMVRNPVVVELCNRVTATADPRVGKDPSGTV